MYISRRALKHFVERRKSELLKHNPLVEVVDHILMIMKNVPHTLESPCAFKKVEEKHIYEKVLLPAPHLLLRVVTEEMGNHLEIKSIHPVKNKNTTC